MVYGSGNNSRSPTSRSSMTIKPTFGSQEKGEMSLPNVQRCGPVILRESDLEVSNLQQTFTKRVLHKMSTMFMEIVVYKTRLLNQQMHLTIPALPAYIGSVHAMLEFIYL